MIVTANEVCFIITAAEVRNAMIDRTHITCVVTAALTAAPKMFAYTKDDSPNKTPVRPNCVPSSSVV